MRRLAVLALIGLLFGTSGVAAVASAAESIEAGPIWSDFDAKGKCPAVCAAAGGKWNGNWMTTVPGRMSVCSCEIRKKGGRYVNAGPLWNNADAARKCPAVCVSHNRSWTGNWETTVPGQMSQCECAR